VIPGGVIQVHSRYLAARVDACRMGEGAARKVEGSDSSVFIAQEAHCVYAREEPPGDLAARVDTLSSCFPGAGNDCITMSAPRPE
jgi:hypothetical protein